MITKYDTQHIPPIKPGLYRTCLTNENYHSPRFWDGSLWWDISISRGKKSEPFALPKKLSRDMQNLVHFYRNQNLYLRQISSQHKVRLLVPYTFFEPKEVLDYLVEKGIIHRNWKEHYQKEMRVHYGK